MCKDVENGPAIRTGRDRYNQDNRVSVLKGLEMREPFHNNAMSLVYLYISPLRAAHLPPSDIRFGLSKQTLLLHSKPFFT
jgi:hypothetical protein